jgi:hypothetical protein
MAGKVAVERERMVNLKAAGDVWALFDEQGLAGDPKAGTGGKPLTEYTNGWINQKLHYPIEGVIDLGAEHDLTDVWYYDISGADSLNVACGDGRTWTPMLNVSTNGYMSWQGKSAPCTGRFVKVRAKSPSTAITEMVLYGTSKGASEPLPGPTRHVRPTMGQLMGTNGFVDDDRDLLQVVSNLREYHSWQWDDGNGDASTPAYPDNKFGWNPSWVRGTGWGWNFDEYYGDMARRGVAMQPVFQGTPAWMFGFSAGDSLKPITGKKDSTLPASYLEHADYLWQFAARFGRTSVSLAALRTDALNTPKSGLGFVKTMEGWNEPDKDWKGVTGYFSPQVLVAMSGADYDGDQGRMGTKVGIKNADPTMQVAMPGIIGINLEYVKAMKYWVDRTRAGSFPADVLNFHHYCNDAGGQGGTATTGISPESDSLRQKLSKVTQWRDRFLPGKELWLSEFGWDTHSGSVYRAKAVGGNNELEMQGRWLVRGFLEIAASGFDKAHQFMLRDIWDSSPGIFSTSGMVHDKFDTLSPKYAKKPSWWYVNTLNKRLRDFRFEADESQGSVRIYRFSHLTDIDSVAYAVWNPDDAAAAAAVAVPTVLGSGVRVTLVEGQALGASFAIAGGSMQVPAVDGRAQLLIGKRAATTGIQRGLSSRARVILGVRADGSRTQGGRATDPLRGVGVLGR